MTINEMIKNVNSLAIPGLEVPLAITVDEINETVRNAMFEYFISTVTAYSEVITFRADCYGPAIDCKEFAVDFIQNNDHAKKCLTATINLVLNGGFSNKSALDGFINRLLWSHIVEACQEAIDNSVPCYDDDDDYDDEYEDTCPFMDPDYSECCIDDE